MRTFPWLLVLLLTALLASTFIPRCVPAGLRPDLFVTLVVFLAARAEKPESVALAWATGLAKDLLSAGPLGMYALLYLLAAFGATRLSRLVNTRLAPVYVPLAGLLALLSESLGALVAALVAGRAEPGGTALPHGSVLMMVRLIVGGAVVTALATPAVVWLLDRMGGWLGARRSRSWRIEGETDHV